MLIKNPIFLLIHTYTRAIIESTKEVWQNERQRLTETAFENGWQDVRQRGSHHRLVKGDKFKVIAVHGKDMPIGLLNAILKRTGLK